jgi:DNA mismatch endonuclease (patch repair protein)
MGDLVTTAQRSALMQRVRQQGTEPELAVRRLLHRAGYRFRLHAKELPGSPDVVFRPRRAAIFVHGCFWHGHDCRVTRPKANSEFWASKIEANRRRDAAAEEALTARGWRHLVVWECETKDEERLAHKLRRFLDPPHGNPTSD